MKLRNAIFVAFIICLSIFRQDASAQQKDNWTADQLMAPAALAKILNTSQRPVIIGVGPAGTIPHSIETGMVSDQTSLDSLKKVLNTLPQDTAVVIYCGCCPFSRCPNIRPAIDMLKQKKFTNYHLLNLPTNVKVDWIDKGYPVVD